MFLQKSTEPAQLELEPLIIFALKVNGFLRFCVIYRNLNVVSKTDSWFISRMDECIKILLEMAVFSNSYANSSYLQVTVGETDRDKTVFTLHYVQYSFVKMVLDLWSVAGAFQRTMNVILSLVIWQLALVYLYDTNVFSFSPSDHIGQVRRILSLLQDTKILRSWKM